MAAALDPEIFICFEGGGKIKQVDGMNQLLQIIVKIGCFLSVFQNNHVVEAVQFSSLVKG
jgi:hypothetical protein